jgi:hypothetical protein
MNISRSALLMPAAAVAALALAACGSDGHNTTAAAAASGPSFQTAAHDAYRFSACMRSHGVTNFPDPKVKPGQIAIAVNPGETNSPAFSSAQNACRGLMPGSGPSNDGRTPAQQERRTQEFIAFAQCLRGHGYTNFPDPNSQGNLEPQQIEASGVNVHAPGFFDVAKGCLPAFKGSISVAQLAGAINKVPAPGSGAAAG